MRAVGLLVLLIAATPLAAAAAQPSTCGVCHPESRVLYAESVHAAEAVACADCHGGDPTTRDVDRAHRGSFEAWADRLRFPELCARCHASLELMRPYNLPVDQYAVYTTSHHGRAVARGDASGAVCTDCHGAHDIRKPSDPTSRVNPRRLAETCGRCHGDSVLMSRYDLDAAVVEDYRSGRHGVALLEEGKSAAPSCTDCHGVHGATPPGIGDIDKVCGSCHEDTRRAFLEGPHHEAMLAAGLAECAACHSNHRVLEGEGDLVAACSECHAPGSDAAALAARMKALIEAAAEEVRQAEMLATQAARGPVNVDDYLARLEQARTYLTEVPPLVHTVSLEPIEQVTRRARSIGEEVRSELFEKLDRRPARLILALIWFYLVMTLAILLRSRRRLRHEVERA